MLSIHEAHGLIHNGSKAFRLSVLPTRNGRKLGHLSAKLLRPLYRWAQVSGYRR